MTYVEEWDIPLKKRIVDYAKNNKKNMKKESVRSSSNRFNTLSPYGLLKAMA